MVRIPLVVRGKLIICGMIRKSRFSEIASVSAQNCGVFEAYCKFIYFLPPSLISSCGQRAFGHEATGAVKYDIILYNIIFIF